MVKTPSIKDIRAAAAARKARAVRRRWLVIGGGVTLVGLLAAFLVVLPKVARDQVQTRLAEALQRPVSVGRVSVNPFRLAVTIDALNVTAPTGEIFASWDRLRVNLNAWSLLAAEWQFDAVELDGFVGAVRIDERGELNFADLLPVAGAGENAATPGAVPVVYVHRLAINGATITFEDRSLSEPFTTGVGPVSFTLDRFRTAGDARAPYDFHAVSDDGETLAWSGGISVDPLRSRGELTLGGVQLVKYAPYYADRFRFAVADGKLDLKLGYEIALGNGAFDLRLSTGEATLTDLALRDAANGEAVLALPRLAVVGITGDRRENWARLGRVEVAGGRVALARSAAGLNLATLFTPIESTTARSVTSAAGVDRRPPAWQVDVVAWSDLTVQWTDTAGEQPVSVAVTSLNGRAEGLSSANDREVDLEVTGMIDGGRIAASGTLQLDPMVPVLAVEAERFPLAVISPYVEPATGVVIEDGHLQLNARLSGTAPGLTLAGEARIDGARLANRAGAEFGGWEQLNLSGVSYTLEPAALGIEEVRWVRPFGRYAIDEQGRSNLPGVAGPEPAAAVAINPVQAEPAMAARVDRIDLVAARFAFEDRSIERPAVVELTELSGTLGGWSSATANQAEVDLTGKVNGATAVRVSGLLNPLGGHTTSAMKIELNRANLMPLDGYFRKFAGYALDGGRLTLDIAHRQSAGAVDSAVVATFDGFNLGVRTPNPEATKLPVALAVALLRDVDGRIVIDVPIEGRTDDPEFRVGRVVRTVLVNLLTKVATSPFALLGAVVGGGGDDLQFQEFAPGSAALSEFVVLKLDDVAAALRARPALRVAVTAHHAGATDAAALRSALLERSLRERAGILDTPEVPWAPGRRVAMLVDAYTRVFGAPPIDPAAMPPVPSPTAAAAVAEPSPPIPAESSPGFLAALRRVLLGPPVAPATAGAPAPGLPATLPPPTTAMPEFAALPAAEIEARLLAQMRVSPEDLAALANARGDAVQAELIRSGVGSDRILREAGDETGARVELSLR